MLSGQSYQRTLEQTPDIQASAPLTVNKLRVNDLELNFLNRSVTLSDNLIITTGLEFNLLALLIENAGTVVSRELIASKLFQRPLNSCDRSINSHMANLRKKFSVVSSTPVIKTLKGEGYSLVS